MKLTPLTQRLAELSALSDLDSRAPPHAAFGLLHAARPAIISALALRRRQPTLVLCAHPHMAQEMAEDVGCWTDSEVAYYPAIEALPYERVRLDRALLAARQAVVRKVSNGQAGIIVAPVRALLQPVQAIPEERLQDLVIQTASSVRVDDLLSAWVERGYAQSPAVDEPGTFARRGGVIDIFPVDSALPIRMDLFGTEVESLRTFDPQTQRSIETVEEVCIPALAAADANVRDGALRALRSAHTAGMTAEAETRWLEDLGRLEAGAAFEDVAVFGPHLASSVGLAALFSTPWRLVVDDPVETYQVMEDLWEQALSVQRDLEEAGDLPKNLKPALLAPPVVRQELAQAEQVELRSGSNAGEGGLDWSGLFTPARVFSGRIRSFASAMRSAEQELVVVASHQSARVRELLEAEGVATKSLEHLQEHGAGVAVTEGSPGRGWTVPGEAFSLYTDYEVFGHLRARPVVRKPPLARTAFFGDFSPGDYVVHVEHGVGRFDSVSRMTIDEAEREYAVVHYAGTDRLYVPTDQLERLTRYVGVGDTPPTLSRLGGGEWQRARQRATKAAAEIAGELVDVYSKRMAKPGFAFSPDAPWQRELESSFAYPETPDQAQAVEDVKQDMEASRPMDRLVCADVGYGKTEVAVRAAFKAVMDGRQVALLVPTTILAQQHFETFTDRFDAFPVRVQALSRFRSKAEQREILTRLALGEVDVLIGTHRLLQKDVVFKDLGLLVIDEEQRFGVKHKETLKKLRETVDVLTLTATPIPRTLHMGLVGIREISVIETAPEGRLPIKTHLQPFDDRLVREAVLRELDRDGQVYVVHNKVSTIEAIAERIRRLVPEARILVGHGQMEEQQLETVMLSFAHHEADVLLCSTIIENGLDIPNVNTIIVNNAQRLGLTQLYQLRGRVGRSRNQAYAYLLYPRDVRLSHDATRRMEAVFEAQELGAGFSIAMRDLEIRGAGNLLGAQQSGHATAIGFDLFTRMIEDAVERLRGVHVEEPVLVTLDLPLTMFLPPEYVGDEAERLSLYRRLAGVRTQEDLDALRSEMRDRFGSAPEPVENLLQSVHLKVLAAQARVSSVSLNQDVLIVRAEPGGLYDRVSLYRRFGLDAKISTNVLRIPRRVIPADWMETIEALLTDMIHLRDAIANREPVGA